MDNDSINYIKYPKSKNHKITWTKKDNIKTCNLNENCMEITFDIKQNKNIKIIDDYYSSGNIKIDDYYSSGNIKIDNSSTKKSIVYETFSNYNNYYNLLTIILIIIIIIILFYKNKYNYFIIN
jgi:hypothetical protein